METIPSLIIVPQNRHNEKFSMKTKESILITAKNHNLIKIFTIFLYLALLNISTALLFYFTNQILIYLSKKRLRNRFQLVSRLNRKFSVDKRYEEPKKEKFIRKLSLPSIFLFYSLFYWLHEHTIKISFVKLFKKYNCS